MTHPVAPSTLDWNAIVEALQGQIDDLTTAVQSLLRGNAELARRLHRLEAGQARGRSR